MREGEGYTLDETLLASQLLAFCEGMLSRLCAASSNIVRRMISKPAGRWSPHSCSKSSHAAARLHDSPRNLRKFVANPGAIG